MDDIWRSCPRSVIIVQDTANYTRKLLHRMSNWYPQIPGFVKQAHARVTEHDRYIANFKTV